MIKNKDNVILKLQMGYRNIFFNAIYKNISDELLRVNKAIQKACIEVDEGGLEVEAIKGMLKFHT